MRAFLRPAPCGAFLRLLPFGAALLACAIPLGAQEVTARPNPRPAALSQTPAPADSLAEAVAAEIALEDALPDLAQRIAPAAPAVPDALALAAPEDATVGSETNLPLPRFVSLKSREGNVRRGPSLSHRIDWVFTRANMPLRITAEYGNWRRVVDREGLGGWVHYALLSGTRTVIVDQDLEPLYSRPDVNASQVALLEAGVIARLEECQIDWCRLSADGYRGWAPKTALWGVGADEILD